MSRIIHIVLLESYQYRSASELRDFVSNSQIYYSDVENDIISFRRVGDVDNVCHG